MGSSHGQRQAAQRGLGRWEPRTSLFRYSYQETVVKRKERRITMQDHYRLTHSTHKHTGTKSIMLRESLRDGGAAPASRARRVVGAHIA